MEGIIIIPSYDSRVSLFHCQKHWQCYLLCLCHTVCVLKAAKLNYWLINSTIGLIMKIHLLSYLLCTLKVLQTFSALYSCNLSDDTNIDNKNDFFTFF